MGCDGFVVDEMLVGGAGAGGGGFGGAGLGPGGRELGLVLGLGGEFGLLGIFVAAAVVAVVAVVVAPIASTAAVALVAALIAAILRLVLLLGRGLTVKLVVFELALDDLGLGGVGLDFWGLVLVLVFVAVSVSAATPAAAATTAAVLVFAFGAVPAGKKLVTGGGLVAVFVVDFMRRL